MKIMGVNRTLSDTLTVLKGWLIPILLISCYLVKEVKLKLVDGDLTRGDRFQALELDTYRLRKGQQIQNLNNLLVDRIKSPDPKKNLDIVLDELVRDLKNGKFFNSQTVQAKRLLLGLETLTGENKCNYDGYMALLANYNALGTRVESIVNDSGLRRVDKIFAHYLKEHIKNCKQVLFRNFDAISENLDENLMKRLNLLLEEPIKALTSDGLDKSAGKSYVERIYNIVSNDDPPRYAKEEHIYNVLKELVKGDPDERFVNTIHDERTGSTTIRRDKFDQLFREYIDKPCQYFMEKFGKDVYDQASFYSMFDKQIQADRADFYEGWLKYRLCYSGGFRAIDILVVHYAEANKDKH